MKIPWRRKWQPTLVFLSGKSHGQRRLMGPGSQGEDHRVENTQDAEDAQRGRRKSKTREKALLRLPGPALRVTLLVPSPQSGPRAP